MNLFQSLLAAAVVLGLGGWSLAEEPATASRFGTADIQRHIETLASPEFAGRGSRAARRLAENYLVGELQTLGVAPLFADSFAQPVPGPDTDDGRPTELGRNLGGWLEGSDPALRDDVIILSAHYDHLGVRQNRIYPGADDNASSVSMVLEVARHLAKSENRPRRSVAILFFDLEEQLLSGLRWFIGHLPWKREQVKLFITADLIGRSLGNLPISNVFVIGSEHAAALGAAVSEARAPAGLTVSRMGVDLVGTRSDYGPFQGEKIPFLFFSCGEHPDYHRPTDTADRINLRQVAAISDVVAQIVAKIGNADATPAWTDKPVYDLDEIETLHRLMTLVIERDDNAAKGAKRLSKVQRLLVTSFHERCARIIASGKVSPDERPWIVRNAQLILLTVF